MTLQLVLATHNAHKVEEFQKILGAAGLGLSVAAYDGPEPVEDGVTFAENALIKARVAAQHTGKIALSDDSGVCVDVLGGAPGIFSARWAGSHGDAEANLRLLLDQLGDIRDPHRTAQFHCTIAVVVPKGLPQPAQELTVEGVWQGRLATEAHGAGGFGYDPIFVPDGATITSAELTADEKNAQSHRARAFWALIPVLRTLALDSSTAS
ncbi:RdgB/HAM1 family non-canonical purine NTP pyrophosphatase [Leifsonia sp. Root112D2]|uniref:RdgB/HAM1 family non-canonical purine NTP pyrophosphatase n=1 Tax=Leifsonia sp. Root112D2 TaxID=1736426 RepID=UPI0006FAE284|nr:RdgB/HAM1 family non-canonical purine NTP pyrophosphatase [Leifsonia sp. Root112D2]KQV07605.1 non-canonical purine NTP pyrophosphatase [Leifsonia sp. Root112D2]